MDFTTGGISAGGFYGAGMAGGRFDRKLNFIQESFSLVESIESKRKKVKVIVMSSNKC